VKGLRGAAVPFAALVLVLAVPFVARKAQLRAPGAPAAERFIVLTPHNESIRFELGRAFRAHMARQGRTVEIDWRAPGGTAEITRYLAGEYAASFRRHWTKDLSRAWTSEVAGALARPPAPGSVGEGAEAWRAFLASNVGCGVDLLFGGGSSEFAKHAKAGRLVDAGLLAKQPALFGPGGIPQKLGGDTYWDKEGRWYGTCLSSFGVCYNRDVLARLGITEAPDSWGAIATPALTAQLALADPTKSGSVGKAFEMIVQTEMNEALGRLRAAGVPEAAALERAPREGWAAAVRLIRRIGANARYFTDFAPRVALDVAKGEAAAGMCIDFFGRFEAEHAAQLGRPGSAGFATARGGTALDADPIGLLRGAPHRDLAVAFIEFVLSEEGQKIWSFKVGAPGGPERYALRRLPILPAMYEPRFDAFRSDPDERPFSKERAFVYHPEWTSHLFAAIALVVRTMCVDPDGELQEAWRALAAAGFPREATAAFDDVTGVDYDTVDGPLRAAMQSADPLQEAHFAIGLVERHRALYRHVAELARTAR
jgi:ABC-type Fe3+ transport system substrate-binding protein